MTDPPNQDLLMVIGLGVLGFLGLTVLWWAFLIVRWLLGTPPLPLERRRRVRWGWLDMLVVGCIGFLAFITVPVVDAQFFGDDPATPGGKQAPAAAPSEEGQIGAGPHRPESRGSPGATRPGSESQRPDAEQERTDTAKSEKDKEPDFLKVAHPIVVLLHARPDVGTLLFCFLMGVVVAPVGEEFLFRLLLQGRLEDTERRLRRRWPPLRFVLRGLIPVLLVAGLFAVLHTRGADVSLDPDQTFRALRRMSLIWAVLVSGSAAWICYRTGARLADFGVVPRQIPGDILLGAGTFLAVAAPMFVIQGVLTLAVQRLKLPVVADPVAVLFFGTVLGVVYYRTQRIVPSVVIHALLNFTSLALAWLMFAR